MLKQIYPRFHARFSSLPLLGPYVEGFVVWLHEQGYPRLPIRLRIRALPGVDESLRDGGVRRIEELTASDVLCLAPKRAEDDVYRAATVRSLARFFTARACLAPPRLTPREQLVSAYREHLERVRGLSESTQAQHGGTAAEVLDFIGFDGDTECLRTLTAKDIETFVRGLGERLCRETLQHKVSQLRSFLRFLAGQRLSSPGLDTSIDTPRVYRGERLPRALAWETVGALLAAIDRSTPMGKRDYAMLLLIASYGLRTSEVAALRLDDIEWRTTRLRVPRPKTNTTLLLPLTDEVGAALIDYIGNARLDSSHREVFLRLRSPAGTLRPTAVTEAFQRWSRRCPLPIPYQGPHCLRHSLAVHLLRQGASLKTIGDLLGHRSAESTCVYLRLHVEDLREVALNLPAQVRS